MHSPLLPATALATTLLFLVPGAAAAQTPHDWSGFYLGLTTGAARSDTRFDFDYTDSNDSPAELTLPMLGASGGLVLGVNFQQDQFVYGLQADGSLMRLNGSYSSSSPDVDIDAQLDALLNLRGRIGLATGPLLLFATAGLAAGHETFNTTILGSSGNPGDVVTAHADGIVIGPTVGMGMEYAVNDKVSLTAEGTVANLGGLTAPGDNGKGSYTARSTAPVVGARAGINFHF